MKNYFKKFSVMFVMTLILMLGCCVSAFATDEGVVGISNLNNTAENSATVGVQLTAPEIGWKRYDDSDSRIKYNGDYWKKYAESDEYNSSLTYTSQADINSKIIFKFYGNKLRIIMSKYIDYATLAIKIDGNIVSNPNMYGELTRQVLASDTQNLNVGIHTVEIYPTTTGRWDVDAIDIDDTGYLVNPNESILLDQSSINLTEGISKQLTATTTPAGAQVTWTSDNTGVATVDSTGKVTGIKEGTCTITATTTDGLTATCAVTVIKKAEQESILLNKSTTDLTTGNSETLIATTTPSAVNVTWNSSDKLVATVDSSGKVTAIGAGTATITATTMDGSNLSSSCAVNVAKKIDPNPNPTPNPEPTGTDTIVNTAYAKGDNTNNAAGEVSIIFNGDPDTTLSVVKTANVKSVWVGDNFTYTVVVTNTGSKTAKAVVINDSAPNHIDFTVDGVTTTQGKVDSSSTSKNVIVNVGDIPPLGTVTITVPATVII